MPAATAKGSIAFSSLILTLITTRWLAGIVENVGVGFASEIAAVGLLGSMGIVLLLDMRLAFIARILVLGLVAWAFTGVLSLTSTSVPAPAAAVSLIALLMLYALVANALFLHFRTTSKASTIATFFVAFVVVGASLSIFQVATGHGFVEGGKQSIVRAFGSDVHPVSFAIQIVIAATGIECQRLKGGHRFGWIHAILLLLAGLALYLTFARTAWALAAATFGLGMFLRGGISSRLAISLLVLPTVVFALMSSDRFADLGSLPFFWSNFSFENVVFDYRYIDNSVSWRIVNWALGYRQALELPLLGHGPGQSAAASYFNLEMHNILWSRSLKVEQLAWPRF